VIVDDGQVELAVVQPSDAAAKTPQGRLAGRLTQPGLAELARATDMISASRRPVLIAGHGARQAAGPLRRLAERLNAPVLTTFKAKGLIPDTHPLGAGVLGRGVSAAAVFDALSRHLPHDAVVTVDVGNHAYSLGRYLESSGQPVLMSGFLGSIGFGYPATLGAWAAAPGRPVVAVTGDGGFGQYAAELTTAVKYGIGVKHVLLDNHSLGKIGKEQLAAGFPVWHTSLHNPD
jgi:thiamine pyrophosphate-dependent acetolactate synthase large subunit-like protein